MNRVNLIPIQRRRAKARAARVRAWIVLNSAFLLLLGAAGATAFAMMSSDHSASLDLAKANQEIDQSAKQLQIVHRKLAEAQQTMASVKAVSQQPDWSVLVAVIAKSLGENVVLNRCDLSAANEQTSVVPQGTQPGKPMPHRFIVQLSGLGRSQADVAGFVLRLENTDLFERVNLLHTNRESLQGSEAVGFELDCPLSTRAGGSP